MKTRTGLKAVALYEAAKGFLILLAGFGGLWLLDKDVADVAVRILHRFHLNPASRYPSIFLDAAERVTDPQLWMLAGFAFLYATIRLAEGWGLWKGRVWAEWLAAVSGAIYIPIEIYELARHATWIKGAAFVCNVAIVLYMVYLLRLRKNVVDAVSGSFTSTAAAGTAPASISARR